jgi:trypsin
MKYLVALLLIASASAAPRLRPLFPRGYSTIVGGTTASQGEFPYQLSFQDTAFGANFHFCGASVLNADTSITAGHCVYGEDYASPVNLRVVAGEQSLSTNSGNEQAVVIDRIAIHEDYSSSGTLNDIALLRGATSFSFNSNVAAVNLPSAFQATSGTCTVTGWGTLSSGGSSPDQLQKVDVPVVSDADCRAAYGTTSIKDYMICAGEEGKDSCQGDSGGPLYCSGYLGGIVSWGRGCADARYPGVYTEVSYFIDWINANKW